VRLEIVRTPAAAHDLQDIWWYSFENWGFERAERYLADLNRAIEALAEADGRRSMRCVAGTVFRLRVNRHYLVFKVLRDRIELTRVLHTSRNLKLHLS
jgi:toxin ParE1/3/4